MRIAINNTGISGEISLLDDYSYEGWHKVIDTNLNAVMYGLKARRL